MAVCLFEHVSEAELAFFSVASRILRIDEKRYLLIYKKGKWYLTQTECPHAGASLARGSIEGGEIICPMHGYSFDLLSGDESYRRCGPLAVWRVYHHAGGLWADL